jgi:hypothetical protein
MIILLTILFTSIIIFLLFTWLSSGSEKELDAKQKEREEKEKNFFGADPRKVYSKKWDPKVPRPRICPACGSALKKHEYLYAAMDENVLPGEKRPVHIYGCRYCYLGQTESSEKIQENLDI